MTGNFVLVPGAWHGGWAYHAVAASLRSRGHRVFAATSPGLGVNDDPAGVTLQDCVDALVADIDTLGTDGITLVGHSWGGYVIAGAVPAVAARLRRAAQREHRTVSILQDLQGPKIRTGLLEQRKPVLLKPGSIVTITPAATARRASAPSRSPPTVV